MQRELRRQQVGAEGLPSLVPTLGASSMVDRQLQPILNLGMAVWEAVRKS